MGLWTAANAEPMSQILDRCVHRKGCGSSEAENGCSIKSKGGTGHCFIVMRKRYASRWGGCAANGHEFRAMFFLPLGPRPGAWAGGDKSPDRDIIARSDVRTSEHLVEGMNRVFALGLLAVVIGLPIGAAKAMPFAPIGIGQARLAIPVADGCGFNRSADR